LSSDDANLIADQKGNVWFIHFVKMDHYIPSLRTLHRYPDLLPKLQVDQGAIKFVIGGANIFCKGLTSPGARMDNVESNSVCAIMAEGKTHALAIGLTKMPSDEMYL
jgi:PUA domain protein